MFGYLLTLLTLALSPINQASHKCYNLLNFQKKNNYFRLFRKWVGLLAYLFLSSFLLGQNHPSAEKSTTKLLEVLTKYVQNGDKIALRDLAKLYDKSPNDTKIINSLKQYTLFTEAEWNWATSFQTKSLTHFLYQKEATLRFSELLNVFYLSPVEERTTEIQVQPKRFLPKTPLIARKTILKLETALQTKKLVDLSKEINQISHLPHQITSNILGNLIPKIAASNFHLEQKEAIISQILKVLPDSLAFEHLLVLTKKKIVSLVFCQKKLAQLSNNFIPANKHSKLLAAYEKLRLEFGNDLKSIKEYGYQKVKLTPLKFFKEKVDYYGWIVATSKDSLFWIRRNALIDMLQTQHPRALFYTIGLQFKNWKTDSHAPIYYQNMLQRLIDVQIKVKDQNAWVASPKTYKAQLNYLIYWASHYDDYEWDNSQKLFINKQLFSNELSNYDRYFRRLNSSNDSIAKTAFIALSEGKPNEIQKLLKKFKPLLRNYNVTLPPLKFKILEQISLLTYFCRRNNIYYHPRKKLKYALEKLSQTLNPKERLQLENQLIESLSLSDLTAIEYYAAINGQNLALNYSAGRLLDYLYTKYWSELSTNEDHFRLFLLKMQLFQKFGGFGISKKYEHKIDWTNPATIRLLKNLTDLETNTYIKQSAAYFLAQKLPTTSFMQLSQFLAAPEEMPVEQLKELSPFSIAILPQIITVLFQQEDKKAIKNIRHYLELHATIDRVPQLFETIQKQWTNKEGAGKVVIQILEHLYQFSFSTKHEESVSKWWELWRNDGKNHLNWGRYLFQQQLDKLATDNSLTISDINQVSQSPFYEEKHRIICLESLKKVKRTNTLYRLVIEPKLRIISEAKYLEDIHFSYKQLDNLYQIFQANHPENLLNFIVERAKNLAVDQQSSLYNTLFRQQWFINHVTKGEISPQKAEWIKFILHDYLSTSTFLTEFEEQNTQLNILQLGNAYATLKEKLLQISKGDLNEGIRYQYLNTILSRIEFHEIIIAFPILKEMEIANKNLFTFLNKDFGLPLFDFSSKQAEIKVLNQLKSSTEYEFYEQVLLDFGLPILNKDHSLNYQKIYQLLDYDLVVPFIGEGGQYRDFYTYGLVKLLELHFKTTLNFHPKLNENQAFYTFNSHKRAAAWKAYLVKEGLVKISKSRSFQ